MFPTVAGPALDVSLCEVESFDLNILRLYYSAILTQKNSLDKYLIKNKMKIKSAHNSFPNSNLAVQNGIKRHFSNRNNNHNIIEKTQIPTMT